MTYSNALFSQVAITAFKTWGSLEKRKGENMSTPQTGQGETSEQIHHSEGRLHVQCKSLKMFLAFHLKLVVVTQTKKNYHTSLQIFKRMCTYLCMYIYMGELWM